MTPEQAVFIAAMILVAGSLVSALCSNFRKVVGWIAAGFVAAATGFAFPAALKILLDGQVIETRSFLVVPILNAQLVFRLDPLSALFLLVVAVISVLTTLYSVSYMSRFRDEHLVRYYPPLLLSFASIIGVVCAADWFFFIVFWEIMSVSAYALVVFERRNPVSLRAGFKFIIMTHAATAAMFIAAILLWHYGGTHSFTFTSAKQALAQLAVTKPALVHILLALWVIGFGTKAGMLPFGSWLPDAYPAAPSSASAAFAGTMTKLGIYGLVRVFWWMLPASSFSQVWGIIIAVLGAGSVFIGTLATLPHHVAHDDTKRFLCFHVVGQIGYMLLGVGMGIYFLPTHPVVAMLALMAGVFHLLNNVLYKTLLFLNSGSILFRTGTRDLNRISGLGAVMPLTALTATVASLSIAGIPPFNGFVSKWMLYSVSIFAPQPFPLFIALGVIAMFISLVSLASFLKYIGSAFLGPLAAPEDNTLSRGEVPVTMQLPQLILAGLCLLFGLVPVLPVRLVYDALASAAPAERAVEFARLVGSSPGGLSLMLGNNNPAGLWFPPVILVVLLVLMLAAWRLSKVGGAATRRVAQWNCGAPVTAQMVRYQASSFYGPFKAAFSRVYPMVGVPKVGYPEAVAQAFDLDRWLYNPLVAAGRRISERLRQTHVGIPQMYLVWQIAGVILVLAALLWMLR